MTAFDAIILGAGAAGLMCAAVAGARGRRVLLLDHAEKVGEKIRISGGGRCNFTNIHSGPKNFLSNNPHFAVSALKRYQPRDFIALVEGYGIAYHEKTLGQLFCDGPSQQIIDMLLSECGKASVDLRTGVTITDVVHNGLDYRIETQLGAFHAPQLVVATGGKSIPKMGATGFGYDIAKRFGLAIVEPRPALVPFTFSEHLRAKLGPLSGVSVDAIVANEKAQFREGLLFTHRGLSGPSILQISSYWREGEGVRVNMLPDWRAVENLNAARKQRGKKQLGVLLSEKLPKRIVEHLGDAALMAMRLGDVSSAKLEEALTPFINWQVTPQGSEGYRTAEVTLGGVDTYELSSKTMAAKRVKGLHFIGEVVDVTGHLGGHNFQWAWASAQAAGQAL